VQLVNSELSVCVYIYIYIYISVEVTEQSMQTRTLRAVACHLFVSSGFARCSSTFCGSAWSKNLVRPT